MKTIHHECGLTMFTIGNQWAVGYRPEKKTFCLGSLTEGLSDLSSENDIRLFEFTEKGPIEVLQFDEETPLKYNQIKAKMGCYWITKTGKVLC